MIKYIKKMIIAVSTAACCIGAAANVYAQQINMNLVYDGTSHKYVAEEIKINVEGSEITGLDVPAVSINDRTMVPARAVFEKLGAEVAWNENTREVYIIKDSDVVTLKIDSNVGNVNGASFTMDTPAKIINDRTLIPIRAAAEALNYSVGWNDATRTVLINTSSGSTDSSNENITPSTPSTPSASVIKVNSITVPSKSDSASVFTINADNAITKYESFIVDDTRLVVDIYSAEMNVTNSLISSTNCPCVTQVRVSQFQNEPEKITRVVFDMAVSVENKVTVSSDKKTISVEFATNTIANVNVSKSGASELIKIYGDYVPTVNVSLVDSPLRLIIDVPNSVSNLKENISVSSEFIEDITTSQYDSKTVRIVAELSDVVEYETYTENGCAVVKITGSTLENISYDTSKHILRLDAIGSLSSSEITSYDDYANKKYMIYLPGDYSDVYGIGTFFVDDSYISKVEVGVENGRTYIALTKKKLISVSNREYVDYMQFAISTTGALSQRVVVIDAGHGLQDPGTSGNGLTEKDVNLDIIKRLYKLLEADESIKVYATRLDDSYPTNISRAQLANDVNADLFVSIHQNSTTNSTSCGTEVLYVPHSNESGGLTSKVAAETLLEYAVDALGTDDRGIKVRDDLIVLNQTKVPAVLVETCFLSNSSDASTIAQDRYKDAMAQAMYEGIKELFETYN